LINYASAVGLGTDAARFERWWPADLHLIGKDITRFHTVIWPAMLMSANLPVPRLVFGHGFLTVDGQRMSKSIPGTIIDPIDAANRHGVDALRLYLIKEIAFGGDGDFSWERFDERYNADLANNLGNLVNRVTAMAHQYRQGRLTPGGAGSDRLVDAGNEAAAAYRRSMDALALHEGAAAAYRLVDATNEYIAATSPWALAKDPSAADRLNRVLFDSAEAIRLAAVLLSPVMPASSREILRRVGASAGPLHIDRDGRWRAEGERVLAQSGALWPRFDSKKGSKEIIVADSSSSSTDQPAAAPPSPQAPPDTRISIDDFMKVELRVAKIVAAEAVPKSKKLLKLQVDLGAEQRTIVAGIAEAYAPETLVGRAIVVVANLKPAKLMGIESNGMVLAASTGAGQPILLSVEGEPGMRVR
jgi:methionyl-tRNA synthetase